ncbi:MAG: alpha/beta hydrolase [Chitinophagaceae bacterium]|jgi:pimeloyl-ACP methyl ester carboxylesterase|nr:alpha/beta hydrolase [Chitinophagaceae bacterium]
MKWLGRLFILLLVLTLVYLLGPNPSDPRYDKSLPDITVTTQQLDSLVRTEESLHPVKPENEARIIWNDDSLKNPTEYAVVYLHGFSASQEEGDPVHTDFARTFGCNLYLARLAEHGLDTADPMINLTADAYWESAKRALAMGKKIGRKVILMGTSTGGSQAIQLAATYPEDVAALVLLSPNIEINDPNAFLLNNPWGLQLARLVKRSRDNEASDQREIYKKHWYSRYRLEGTVALQEMLETSMIPENFRKITQPVLLLYYYKDESHQDPVVKVSAMQKMFDQLSTPPAFKRQVAIPEAGDHVIGSYIKSNDLPSVQKAIHAFAVDVLKLSPR